MKNVKEVLREISYYFNLNRRAGHTTTMQYGTVNNPEAIVVTSTHVAGRIITRGDRQGRHVILDDFGGPKLRGIHRPMVFDNEAMRVLCVAAVEKFNEQDEELEYLRDFSRTVQGEADMYRRLYNEASENLRVTRKWLGFY